MRTVWILTIAHALAFPSVSAIALLGSIVGESVAPPPTLTTLPMALFM